MPDKQYYSTSVSKEAILETFRDIRENEQAVQAFTQTPSTGQPGADEKDGLCAQELFYYYTARIMMEKTVFTR